MDSARALIARGWGVSLVSRCLRVSRAQLHVILRRTDDWKDGRRSRHSDDTDVLLRIHHVIGELPTYGYRRVWALLRRQAELDGMPAINAKRVYRIMRQNALLLERKTAVPPSKRAHTGKVAVKESNQRWCSDGFEFRCDNGEKLRVTFALDFCDREALHWAVTTGGFDSETVQDVMLGAVERRFGSELPTSPVEWLTDNGSCYRANETRQFARMLGLEPKNTAVRSPESNGIAESFVKTIKRDYISIMPKPDGLTAAKNLAEAFEHYNEWHPHSAKAINDGALTGSSSAVITEKNCESRSRWTAVTVRHCTGQSLRAASTVKQYRTSCQERWNAASATSFRRLQ